MSYVLHSSMISLPLASTGWRVRINASEGYVRAIGLKVLSWGMVVIVLLDEVIHCCSTSVQVPKN